MSHRGTYIGPPMGHEGKFFIIGSPVGYLSFRGMVQGEILDSFPSTDIPAAYVRRH